MECTVVREAISALLDDEAPEVDQVEIDRHLDACADCRNWRLAAAEVTRRTRVTSAVPTPGSVDRVLEATEQVARPAPRLTPSRMRLGLFGIAIAQAAITVPALLFAHSDATRDRACFEIAIAVGFLAAAWRPGRASGMLPVIRTTALLLLVAAGLDIANGSTRLVEETPDLVPVFGWLALRYTARVFPPTGGPGDPGVLSIRDLLRSGLTRQRRLRVPQPHPGAQLRTRSAPIAATDVAPSAERQRLAS